MTEPLIVADERDRVCPACQAPMELAEQGTDRHGAFEVWSCTNRTADGALMDSPGHVSAGAPKDGRILLRQRDYELTARRRSRIAAMVPDPKHAGWCPRGAGLPGKCVCRGYPHLKKLNDRAGKAS